MEGPPTPGTAEVGETEVCNKYAEQSMERARSVRGEMETGTLVRGQLGRATTEWVLACGFPKAL